MKALLFLIATLITFHAIAQKTKYVCEPCGAACDLKVHSTSGTCPDCNMPLVEESSVHFTNISPEEFCGRIAANSNAIVLDVRSASEFDGSSTEVVTYGHFKNAMNINVNQLESRLTELTKYKDSEILVYCSHSRRSPRASYILGLNGFKNVKNMTGGVSAIRGAKAECFLQNYAPHAH